MKAIIIFSKKIVNESRKSTFLKNQTAKIQKLLVISLFCLFLPVTFVFAQAKLNLTAPIDNPLSAWNKRGQETIRGWVIRAAEKMTEENYGFKPTNDVRSYGQILGHIADMEYVFCSAVLGEKNPAPRIEKTKTSKAEIIEGLKNAFDYCTKAYDNMTDASASQMVKHYGNDMPKLFLLNANISHAALHYGNLVTYMRLKNIVPPSTEDTMVSQPKK